MATETQHFTKNFAVNPTENDLELWESLSRDQQVEHFRGEIQEARDSGVGNLSAEEIKQRALDSAK